MASADAPATFYPWEAHYPDGIDWRAPIDRYPLHQLIDEAADRFGDRVCADFMDKVWTYGQIADHVDRFAAGLQSIGIVKGSRVGLFLPNCPYYPIAYFAILKCGGTVVNFNPLYAKRELEHQIADSGTEIMVTLDLKVLHDKLAPVHCVKKAETVGHLPNGQIAAMAEKLAVYTVEEARYRRNSQ